jgi:hypothetical protein
VFPSEKNAKRGFKQAGAVRGVDVIFRELLFQHFRAIAKLLLESIPFLLIQHSFYYFKNSIFVQFYTYIGKGRLGTVDLLVVTSYEQIMFTCFTKQATLGDQLY